MKVLAVAAKRKGQVNLLIDTDLADELPRKPGTERISYFGQRANGGYLWPMQCIAEGPPLNSGTYRFGFAFTDDDIVALVQTGLVTECRNSYSCWLGVYPVSNGQSQGLNVSRIAAMGVKIEKWGDDLGGRLPSELVAKADL